jgi:hypothetical protein
LHPLVSASDRRSDRHPRTSPADATGRALRESSGRHEEDEMTIPLASRAAGSMLGCRCCPNKAARGQLHCLPGDDRRARAERRGQPLSHLRWCPRSMSEATRPTTRVGEATVTPHSVFHDEYPIRRIAYATNSLCGAHTTLVRCSSRPARHAGASWCECVCHARRWRFSAPESKTEGSPERRAHAGVSAVSRVGRRSLAISSPDHGCPHESSARPRVLHSLSMMLRATASCDSYECRFRDKCA